MIGKAELTRDEHEAHVLRAVARAGSTVGPAELR